MQCLTNGVVIVLLHCLREQCSSRQFSHCKIVYLTQYLINSKDKRDSKMLVIYNILMLVSQSPSNFRYGRAKFKCRNRFAQQNNSSTSQFSVYHDSTIRKEIIYRPSINFFRRNIGRMHFFEHYTSFCHCQFIQICDCRIRNNLSGPIFSFKNRLFKNNGKPLFCHFHQ